MVHLGGCHHRFHLPRCATLRVRAVKYLRCPPCRATVTVEEADGIALQQHSEEVMAEAMAVARRAMPAGGRGGSSTRAARNGKGGRVIYSICHGLVEKDVFVQVPCPCDVHRRCALGFVEDAIPRARVTGATTLTSQVTCPNPSVYEVHREVGLKSLLQQIRGGGRSADTAERAIRARITAAELLLSRRSTTLTGAIDLSRCAAERGEEDIREDWRGTIPQYHKWKRHAEPVGSTL